MRKHILNCAIQTAKIAAAFFICLSLTSCGQPAAPGTEGGTESQPSANSSVPTAFVSEDTPAGNIGTTICFPIMETEKGYYFNASYLSLNLFYHDKTTDKVIPLCSKPECRHDGSEFCTATNANYAPLAMQLYNNRILVSAYTYKNDQIEFKLLEIAADGSSLTELNTYYTCSAQEIIVSPIPDQNYMIIHRNKVILQLSLCVNAGFDASLLFGTAILNLDNGQLEYVYEEPVSGSNPQWVNPKPQGDYLYYVVREPHKFRLHRFHLTDKTDETLELVTNFDGNYFFLDEEQILYFRSSRSSLWLHALTDHSNTELDLLYTDQYFELENEDLPEALPANPTAEDIKRIEADGSFLYLNNHWYERRTIPFVPSAWACDGEYLYLMDPYYIYSSEEDRILNPEVSGHFTVYDKNLQKQAWIAFPNYNLFLGLEPGPDSIHTGELTFRFLGGQIYFYRSYTPAETFCIDRADFLTETFDKARPVHNPVFPIPYAE